jgi:hypothetical protein
MVVSLGCSTARRAYYDASESYLGYAKRERLVNRVEAARDEQTQAKEQFVSALDQFKSLINIEGGDLEATYRKLNREYERSVDQADAVRGRIRDVENVASALFSEWESEIGQMSDPELKEANRKLRSQTKSSYDQLIERMRSAAGTMEPVLVKFKDRVLFLKGNLNARAIAALQGTEVQLGAEIDNLVREMEASIAEADAFIAGMKG